MNGIITYYTVTFCMLYCVAILREPNIKSGPKTDAVFGVVMQIERYVPLGVGGYLID